MHTLKEYHIHKATAITRTSTLGPTSEIRRDVIVYLRQVSIKRACGIGNRGKTCVSGLLPVKHTIYRE